MVRAMLGEYDLPQTCVRFSIAGKIFRPERCSLCDKNFETLMMIKCNSEIRTLIMKK